MRTSLLRARRGPRTTFHLGSEKGVYALFLSPKARLPGIDPGKDGLIYIGLAAGQSGLAGRCHFAGRTVNHSPRKSLAVILMKELRLKPVLVIKPNSLNTWGLERSSDAALSAWMHENLHLAVAACDDPDEEETELVRLYAPPLNLSKCDKTPQHRRLSAARRSVMARLDAAAASVTHSKAPVVPAAERARTSALPRSDDQSAGRSMDSAESIACRYGLNPKSYRQRLRSMISWYRKPQDWTFERDSEAWRDMIAVAETMVRR